MPHLEDVRHFVADLFDKKEKKSNTSSNSTSPNPNGKKYGKPISPPVPEKDELVNKLGKLSLDAPKGKHPDAEFIGGFKHGPANPNTGRATPPWPPPSFPVPANQMSVPPSPSPPGPLPRPPQLFFPTPLQYPQSLTMQHAVSENSRNPVWLELEPATPETPKSSPRPPKLPARPHSDEPQTKTGANGSPARLEVQRPVSSPPMTPKTSKAFSGEGTPGKDSGNGSVQCSGQTGQGNRCKRKVKAGPPLNVVDHEASLERYCHQHRKEILTKQSGFHSRTTGAWVNYSDYIPAYLHEDTQTALRLEMEKPPSQSDESGFIYAFEIRDPDAPFVTKLKVGRTTNLKKRLNEWDKQCDARGKEQILRGWWPGNIMDKDLETSLLKVVVQEGQKGKYHHKLERLVHLELADLVLRTPYLNEDFPNILTMEDSSDTPSASGKAKKPRSNPGTPGRNGNGRRAGADKSDLALNILQKANEPCPACGQKHKEIFPFVRPTTGPYKDQEWDKLVKPVIEKWGWFVETLA